LPASQCGDLAATLGRVLGRADHGRGCGRKGINSIGGCGLLGPDGGPQEADSCPTRAVAKAGADRTPPVQLNATGYGAAFAALA